MKFSSLQQRFLLWFMAVSLPPVLLISYAMFETFSREIEQTIAHNLSALADKKHDQIDTYFHELRQDVTTRARSEMVTQALPNFIYTSENQGFDSTEYAQLYAEYRENFQQISENSRYYDIFLISPKGIVVYSQKNEADFASNLFTGTYRNTGLAKAVRNAASTLESNVSDFELYAPSNNTPAMFVAAPVLSQGKLIGFFAVQVNHDRLAQVIGDSTGLGETGETVVARQEDNQYARIMAPLRNEPDATLKKLIRLDKSDIQAPHIMPLTRALNGERGSGYQTDYLGESVVAAWCYLPQLKWGMVVKIDTSEALAPLYRVRTLSTLITSLITIIILFVAIVLTRRIVVPLNTLNQYAHDIAEGKFEQRVPVQSKDELGQLALTFNRMAEQLQQSYNNLEEQVRHRTAQLTKSLAASRIKDAAISASVNPIAILDLKGNITYVNQAFEKRIHFASAPDLIGENLFDLLNHDGQLSLAPYALQKNGYWVGDIQLATDEKNIVDLQLSATLVKDDTGRSLCILTSFVDITTQKLTEKALLDAKQEAEATSRTKSEFLANMSHEIRTPMNAIIGLTQLVLESNLTEQQEDFLRKAHNSARALLGILNDILDYSKIEAGQMGIEHIPFDLETTLSHVANLFETALQEKQLELFFEITPNTPVHLLGDPLRLSQVITNLLSNAIKFTEEGEIHVKIEQIKVQSQVATLRISVRDTGIGLTREQASRIFQSFTQADESTTRKYGGTGLGLSISQQLVKLMGGEITASGVIGQGTTFTFTIQVEIDSNATTHYINHYQLRDLNVLVVDDQETSRVILKNLLESWGARVRCVDSGQSALSALREIAQTRLGKYDMLLLDWRMPSMDGVEFIKRMEESVSLGVFERPLKIVMVTAHDKNQLMKEAASLSLHGVLTKPITPSQLFNTLVDNQLPQATAGFNDKRRKQKQAKNLQGLRVLLVEDNKINRLMASEFLERRGVSLSVARDGAEAVQRVQEKEFDIILMDLHMPVMDGLEATKRIRKLPHRENIPIIAMTAAVLQEDVARCNEVGMVDFIAKPIDPDNVVDTLLKWATPPEHSGQANNTAAGQLDELVLPQYIPEIDLEAALRRVEQNRVLLAKLLLNFVQDNEHAAEQIDTSLAKGDTKQALVTLHTIKGASANLGITALSDIARQWEQELKTGQVSSCAQAFAEILEKNINNIRKHITHITPNPSQVVDHNELHKALQQAIPYLEQQELLPDELMKLLYQFARAMPSETQLAQLVQQIDAFEHQRALEIAQALVKQYGN